MAAHPAVRTASAEDLRHTPRHRSPHPPAALDHTARNRSPPCPHAPTAAQQLRRWHVMERGRTGKRQRQSAARRTQGKRQRQGSTPRTCACLDPKRSFASPPNRDAPYDAVIKDCNRALDPRRVRRAKKKKKRRENRKGKNARPTVLLPSDRARGGSWHRPGDGRRLLLYLHAGLTDHHLPTRGGQSACVAPKL